MLIESCLFYNCSSESNGGAIFFNCNENGASTIIKTCAYFCFSGSNVFIDGQFAYILTSNMKINYNSYLSISKCAPKDFYSLMRSPITNINGNQSLSNFNSSFNNVFQRAAFNCVNSNGLIIQYSTFFSNKPTEWICLRFESGSSFRTLKKSNIVNQSSPVNYGVVFNTDYNIVLVKNCVFYKNLHTLFFSFSGEIVVSNCYLDNFNFSQNWGTIIFDNLYFSTSTYNLYHFFTKFCENYIMSSIPKKIFFRIPIELFFIL